ncbi:hypothetical protein [Chryseobacterium caseinilyticum]|uniref:Holin n=1 Tax=Chryseobacterium caseinilyticum TaxID=2771428 RepID=A0ABR8ZH45_9FLAO|nr:hypothetical protein [Chryseobacterium caseinilyticum]MBD8084638.1 hypothetical protein [Chryseobacterium caseinilyticum]
MNIIKRVKAPTPKLFRILRNIGLLSAGIGGVLIASPVRLSLTVDEVAKYLVLAGGIISAISQITVDDKVFEEKQYDVDNKIQDHE